MHLLDSESEEHEIVFVKGVCPKFGRCEIAG